METNKKEAKDVKDVPSKDVVREWMRKDIAAASYSLSLLMRYPDIIETMADQLYDRIVTESKSPLIDSVAK